MKIMIKMYLIFKYEKKLYQMFFTHGIVIAPFLIRSVYVKTIGTPGVGGSRETKLKTNFRCNF